MKCKYITYLLGQIIVLLLISLCCASADAYPESDHPYASSRDITWTYSHNEPAEYISVTFSEETSFEQNCDYLYVTEPDGQESRYTGTELAGKTIGLKGNSFTLRLKTDSSINHHGFAITAIAAITEEEYKAYNPIIFVVADGILTNVKGGKLDDDLVIPEVIDGQTITGIGSHFLASHHFKSITLPDSIETIHPYAFYGCSSLTTVKLSKNLISVGSSAFAYNSALTHITLPDSVETIGSYAFYECSSLTDISLSKNLVSIGTRGFSGCSSLTHMTLPDSITEIEDSAFDGCTALRSVTLGSGITSIPDRMFSNCNALVSIDIPANISSIGKSAFSYCENLAMINIAGENVSFAEKAFANLPGDFATKETTTCFVAPAGSATYDALIALGLPCKASGHSFTLLTPLSTDPANPTVFPAVSQNISLENKEGVQVVSVSVSIYREYSPGSTTNVSFTNPIEGNTWQFSSDYKSRASIVFLCENEAGEQFYSPAYHLYFGMADLVYPEFISPQILETHDGMPEFPLADFEITWTGAINCHYEVSLVQGMSIFSNWSTDVTEPRCVIPASAFEQGKDYWISVHVIDNTTEESISIQTPSFYISAPKELLASNAKLISPYANSVIDSHEEWMITIPYQDELVIAWEPVPNAAECKYEIWAFIPSGAFYTPYEDTTTESSVTLDGARLKRYMDVYQVTHFMINLEVVGTLGDTYTSQAYFRFGTPGDMALKAGNTPVSFTPNNWTTLNAGNQQLTWSPVDGADSYACSVLRQKSGSFFNASSTTTDGCVAEAELADGNYYVIVLAAMNGSSIIKTDRYDLSVNGKEYPKPAILSPVKDYVGLEDILVQWTDAGAESYTLRLGKQAPTDYSEEENFFGDPLDYYSITVEEHTGLTGTSHTFDASLLEYGGMYRILLTAIDSDGTETKTDFLFRVMGDPANAPDVSGIICSDEPSASPKNAACSQLTITWAESEDVSYYETQLRTLNAEGTGSQLDQVSRVKDRIINLKGSSLKTGVSYLLVLRAYDKDLMATEYRFYFTMLDRASLKTLTVPAMVRIVEDSAWENCVSLEQVVFTGGQITAIGRNAFKDCANLLLIEIPASVSEIGSNAFSGCPKLTILCLEHSPAHQYALDNGIRVILQAGS